MDLVHALPSLFYTWRPEGSASRVPSTKILLPWASVRRQPYVSTAKLALTGGASSQLRRSSGRIGSFLKIPPSRVGLSPAGPPGRHLRRLPPGQRLRIASRPAFADCPRIVSQRCRAEARLDERFRRRNRKEKTTRLSSNRSQFVRSNRGSKNAQC